MAEKIAGLTITKHDDGMYCGVGMRGEFWVHANDDKEAAERLVASHWREVCKIVSRRQGFRCLHCARLVGLSHHHIKFRSHGRSDDPSNVEALCESCHEKAHKHKDKALNAN